MPRIVGRVQVSVVCFLLWLGVCPSGSPFHHRQGGTSLQFYGNGVGDIDRVKIRLDAPARPIDVDGDFTLEFWIKAQPEENDRQDCLSGGDNWIVGHIIFDRDIYGAGDWGDYGVSLGGGRIMFGVNNGRSGQTICGTTNVADRRWHHIALTRRQSDGLMRLFVDGVLDAEGIGPTGNISYRDGRATDFVNDPYLVIGAEKHDVGPSYPSFRGWLDEIRLSDVVRYDRNFVPPTLPFVSDARTVALYHCDEGGGDLLRDHSGAPGGPSHGMIRYGGEPAGPRWSTDTPFAFP